MGRRDRYASPSKGHDLEVAHVTYALIHSSYSYTWWQGRLKNVISQWWPHAPTKKFNHLEKERGLDIREKLVDSVTMSIGKMEYITYSMSKHLLDYCSELNTIVK